MDGSVDNLQAPIAMPLLIQRAVSVNELPKVQFVRPLMEDLVQESVKIHSTQSLAIIIKGKAFLMV